jgi:hypothetical protein
VLLLAVLFLPVSTCFAGSRMNGFEAAVALTGGLFRGWLWAGLPLYATGMTVVAAVALMAGRVSRGLLFAVLLAPVAAAISASFPLQIGYVIWFFAVTGIALTTAILYASGDRYR